LLVEAKAVCVVSSGKTTSILFGVTTKAKTTLKPYRGFAVAFVSEIGPGFSPDIKEKQG
jgi:hypothetical protein